MFQLSDITCTVWFLSVFFLFNKKLIEYILLDFFRKNNIDDVASLRKMDEESIRDLFLVQLATSFSAYSSAGEAFNHKGKTDLMVKNGDDILFIAECKFWKGAKVLIDAISQLLGYLTWRDSKTALLIFNRDVGMTTALQSIEDAISKHSNYLSGKKNGDARFDCVFHLNEDKNRRVKMAIFVFDFHEL